MGEDEYSIAFSEVLDVLQHSEIDIIEKIPLEIIKKLKEHSSKKYISNINDIDNFCISKKAQALLAVIYQDYLCDEDEKKELDKELLENEKKYQEELKEKYKSNNIFKKQEHFEKNNVNLEGQQMTTYKEPFIKKIIKKIKSIIMKKY